ncbi:hypothetical protein AVEN_255603-1, partial [Araneus ventricosus]
MATLHGKATRHEVDTNLGVFWISLLVSGSLVIFSSPSLGASSMAVGDGTPGATASSGGPA